MDTHVLVGWAAKIMEWAGILAMVGGAVFVGILALRKSRRLGGPATYRNFRRNLGRSILLGLEFLVAADIIRTVSQDANLYNVAVLGAIVGIRTFLSWTLELELHGRWPWRRGDDPDPGSPPSKRVRGHPGQVDEHEAHVQ